MQVVEYVHYVSLIGCGNVKLIERVKRVITFEPLIRDQRFIKFGR